MSAIDEAIEILYERNKCLEYVTDNDDEAFKLAISIMQKYQKIQQIHKQWFCDFGSADAYTKIGDVLKDGNVD